MVVFFFFNLFYFYFLEDCGYIQNVGKYCTGVKNKADYEDFINDDIEDNSSGGNLVKNSQN